MNHKTIQETVPVGQLSRWHFNPARVLDPPDLFTGSPRNGWEKLHDTFGTSLYTRLKADIVDLPAFSEPHMQDQVRTSLSWNYSSVTPEGTTMTVNPGLNQRLYQIGVPGEGILLTDDYVQSQLADDSTGIPWNPLSATADYSSHDLYARLAQGPIRPRMPEMKDPLETEFSLWYLLRDVFEVPKLVKGLYSNMKTIKSLIRKDGVLKMLSNTVSLKQFASMRLAHEYGLLPTIADLREYWDMLHQLVDIWRDNVHGMGALRTYRYKLVLKDVYKADSKTRLRFPVYASTYHYADAYAVHGPLTLHQTVKFYFVCPHLSKIMGALKAFVDASGILDPAAIWDSVPFSFVVDWFFDVTRIAQRLKLRLVKPTMVIADYAESLHRETVVDVDLDYVGTTAFGQDIPRSKETFCTFRVYQQARRRQFEFSHLIRIEPKSILGHGFTLKRVINGACIVVGNVVKTRIGRVDGVNYRDLRPPRPRH